MHTPASTPTATPAFFGRTVARAAFVIAVLGWGLGFYSPPIFIYAVVSRTQWPLTWVSGAVTLHFLVGALVVANLPGIYRRLGVARATRMGAIMLAAGVVGWSHAQHLWQLVAAALLTGSGWVFLGAAAINTIISPWFWKKRPTALAFAYNGASIGGVIFAPLWAALITAFGFASASLYVAIALLAIVIPITWRILPHTPASKRQGVDGEPFQSPADNAPPTSAQSPGGHHPGTQTAPISLWRNRRFLTLVAAMALGLFAQIGLIAQLYSLLAGAWGSTRAGWLMGMMTACSVGGRTLVSHLIGPHTRRRHVAAASYAMQALGTLILLSIGPNDPGMALLGLVLFGLGIGNATSLPPLIAQQEFPASMVAPVVARSVAVSQALYAFAPMTFATLLVPAGDLAPRLGVGTTAYFSVVLAVQWLAIVAMLSTRRR